MDILDYVSKNAAIFGGSAHGDFMRDGIVYVDIEFRDVYSASQWLNLVDVEPEEFWENSEPRITGDLRDPVTSVHDRVVLTVTVPGHMDTSTGKVWSQS